MPTTPEGFLRIIAPSRQDLVVAVECIFTWYWLADLGAKEGIAFVLGHALYMKAIQAAKPRTTRLMRTRLPSGCAGACYPKPTSIRQRCGRRGTYSAAAVLWCASAPNSWP